MPCALGGRGDEQVGYARRAVLAALGEMHLDLDGALLHRRGEVLDGHQRQRRLPGGLPEIRGGTSGESDFEEGDRGDVHQAATDAIGPFLGVGAGAEPDQGGLVDEPGGRHCQAWRMTSSSPRSPKVDWKRVRSATVTTPSLCAAWARVRRRYSLRDNPRRPALLSIAATISSGTSRMSRSVIRPHHLHAMISDDITASGSRVSTMRGGRGILELVGVRFVGMRHLSSQPVDM